MAHQALDLRTDDGICPTHAFHPDGNGPWPGVIFFMDGIGVRPALFTMGERLAAAGYYVLLPDLFYRAGAHPPFDAKTLFTDEKAREELRTRFAPIATAANIMRDCRTFLDHLAAQSNVRQPKVGTTGYCMGGRLSLCAAGHFPDRIAAAASYHGGNLANDAPDSPHLLAPKVKARVYVACATSDPSFPDDQKQRLEQALAAAHVDHVIETYPARHGWVPSDTPVHDAAAAEHHWQTLFDLFGRTLAG
jgi:carboxymethylenebutenolidase